MYAKFTCEQCQVEYDSEDKFVRCHGDVCQEDICNTCATKCAVPDCKYMLCENCGDELNGYCIDHAIWDGDFKIIDYIAVGKTFAEAKGQA